MSVETPNIVDVAIATGGEVNEILSLISDSMARDAEHRQRRSDQYLVNAQATAVAMEHGVTWALSYAESIAGGTTRQYEGALDLVAKAVNNAIHDGPIRRWYREQLAENPFVNVCHPVYRDQEGDL